MRLFEGIVAMANLCGSGNASTADGNALPL